MRVIVVLLWLVLDEVPRSAAVSGARPLTTSRRRRPPNEAEQARRKAWGEKWGKLVSDATREWRDTK